MNGFTTAVEMVSPSTDRSFSRAFELRKKMQCRDSYGMLLTWSALTPTPTPFFYLPFFNSVAKISLCCMFLFGGLWARKVCCPVWRFCGMILMQRGGCPHHTWHWLCVLRQNCGLVQLIVCEYRFWLGGFLNGLPHDGKWIVCLLSGTIITNKKWVVILASLSIGVKGIWTC